MANKIAEAAKGLVSAIQEEAPEDRGHHVIQDPVAQRAMMELLDFIRRKTTPFDTAHEIVIVGGRMEIRRASHML